MPNYLFYVQSNEKLWDTTDLVNFCIEAPSRNFKSYAKSLGINVENEERFIGVKRFQELISESNMYNSKMLPKDMDPYILKEKWQILEDSYSNEIKELFWSKILIGYNTWAKILDKKELPVLELDLEVYTTHPDVNFDFHKIGRDYKERCFLIRLIHDIYLEINEIGPDNNGEQNPIRQWFEKNNIDYFDIGREVASSIIIGYSRGKIKKSKEKDDYTLSTTYKVLIHPGWFKDENLPKINSRYYNSYAH